MGFIALAAFISMLVSFPVNEAFRQSEYAGQLFWVFLKLFIGIVIIWAIARSPALQARVKLRRLMMLIAIAPVRGKRSRNSCSTMGR